MRKTEIEFLDLGDALRGDERGVVYFPFQHLPGSLPREEMCTSCHVVSIEPGQIRGQHHHPGKTEWLFLVHGSGRLFWRGGDGRLRERLFTGMQTMVVIPPGMPHTLRNDGSGPLYLLAWRAALEPTGDEPETVPAALI